MVLFDILPYIIQHLRLSIYFEYNKKTYVKAIDQSSCNDTC